MKPERIQGFTLIELLFTVAIVAIVSVIAAGGFGDLLRGNTRTTIASDFHASLKTARNTAISRGIPVVVRVKTVDSAGVNCNTKSGYYDNEWGICGWEIATTTPAEVLREFKYDSASTVLNDRDGTNSVNATTSIEFRPTGEVNVNQVYMEACNKNRSGERGYQIELKSSGQTSFTDIDCS